MNIIDTHCHLYYDDFSDLNAVLERAEAAGVRRVITQAIDLKTSELSLKMAEAHKNVFATVGVHPHESAKLDDGYLKEVESMAAHPKAVAVGEIGLDYFYDFSPRDTQIRIFREHLELAKSLEMPVVIHNRESDADMIAELTNWGKKNAVMHSYAASLGTAKKLLKLDLYFGFSGMLTFKNTHLTEVAEIIPLNRILVETDAPYLTPVPYRGKRNEPAYTAFVARRLAEIKGESPDTIADASTANAETLFPKLLG